MSKAKGKPKTPTTTAATNAGAWEASLTSTLINDDELKVSVYLISPEKVEDKLQLQLLGGAVETNVRQRFVYIEKDALVAQGKDLGKSKDSGTKTAFPEVFALLKSVDDLLPSSVLARLLKVKILEHRDAELTRREELQQEELQKARKAKGIKGKAKGKAGHASRSPAKSTSPDKGGKKDAKKGGKKSPVKKEGGANVDPEAEITRGKCPLKKRGEEKEEPAKIDDYPEFSPDLYVLCVGFEQADFLAECQKTNLPINSLLRSNSFQYSYDYSFMEHITSFNMGAKFRHVQVVAPDDIGSPEMAARVEAHQELLDKFWSGTAEQASEVPLPTWLMDVGFETMSLPRLVLDNEIKKDNEKMEEIKLALYQRVADKVYSLHNSMSQFRQYYKGMDLIEVVDLSATSEEGELLYPLDMRYYNKIISLLPYESVTHMSVLNCMLEQVCEEQQEKQEEVKEAGENPMKKQLGLMIQSLPLTLNQQIEFEGFMALKQEKVEKEDQPVVLKAADDIGLRSFHLKPNLYPLNDLSLLKHSISNAFLELPDTTPEILTKIQSLAYETETFCGQTTSDTVNKALRQFAFENFDMRRGQTGISKLRDPAEYFWDIELLLRAGVIGEESLKKLKDVEVSDPTQKLDHYHFRTSYEKDALLQVLSEAFYEYPYCERIYHRHEHSMLLLFHAGLNDKRHSQSTWSERVHTEIGFHYFMSRTKDKFSSLLEQLPPLTPAPVPSEGTAPPTPVTPAVEEPDEEPEFQMPENRLEGFKKRSDLKEEDKERVSTGKKAKGGAKSADKKGGRKGSPSPKRKGSPSKSPKRSAGPSRQSSAKSVDKNKVDFDPAPLVPEPEMDIVLEDEPGKNVFVGFKLPNQIFEATGNTAHCHPADGSLVRVEKWGFEGKNPKTRVSLLKDGHVLSLNYALKSDMDLRNERKTAEENRLKAEAETAAAADAGKSVADSTAEVEKTEEINSAVRALSVVESEIPLAKSVSFNAQLKSGMCMSFKKPGEAPKSVQLPDEEEDSVGPEEPLPSVMILSVPTGLVIEYCLQQEGSDYYAVRQTYESKTELKHKCEQVQAKTCAVETSRLCLSNGAVVKHMKNGQTVILYPDGGYSIKHLPPPPPPPPPSPEPVQPADPGSNAPTPVETPAPPPPHLVWEVTKEQGEREEVMSNGEVIVNSPLQCYTATDPESKEVMFTRMDSILAVTRPDGTRIVDHTDGTRITTITSEDGEIVHKVECVGYATVRFAGTTSHTIFGTPTRVISQENRTFVIEEEDGSLLNVSPYENKVDFVSKLPTKERLDPQELNTVREMGQMSFSELGVHYFGLDNAVCFEHTDVAGNIFNISYEGKIGTEQPDAHVVQHLDHFYQENEVGAYHDIEEKYKPPMRLFIIHSDETGTEIMDKQKCIPLFESADKNADVVKVEEDVETDDLAKGYTFLTPFYSSPGSKWIKEFDEGDIVPGGLIYAGTVKPAEQIMGGWEKRVASPVMEEPELPPAIHYNQVIEESPLDSYRRELVVTGIRAHALWMVERELNSNKATIPDERSDREKQSAEQMVSKVGRSGSVSVSRTPQNDISFGVEEASDESRSDTEDPVPSKKAKSMDRLDKRRNTVDSVTRKYSTAVSNNPFKMKMKLKKGIIPQAKWDSIMREKMEVNILKSDLRNFRVPPYFDSKFGLAFLASLKEGPDMNGLSVTVPSPVLGTPSDKSLDAGGKGESLSTSMILIDGEENQGSTVSLTQTGTTPRPGNPTPNVAKGSEADLKGSPKQSSPHLDQPSPKANRNLSPVHDEEIETPVHDFLSSRQTSQPTSGTVKSLHVDVKGDVRKSKVKIPRSIQGYKPGAEPNSKFLKEEEPVRRGVKTSSVLAAGKRKHITEMRGFQVYPPEVSFGVLCPGGMYATTVTLKNIGIDSCRFQVKCPPNKDGVSVALHSETNFVAAGMSVKFDVCVTAIDVAEIGHVSLEIIILMETEVFRLPVLATVLPIQEYDERSKSGRLTRLPQHIKIIDVSSFVNSASSGLRDMSGTPYSSDWQSSAMLT